jgi:hypothetical protein
MKTMPCQAAQAQLLDYLEGELDDALRAALHEHVASCPRCSGELQEIERLRGALGRERVPDPEAAFWGKFPDRVWQAYRAELTAARRPSLAARVAETLARARLPRVPGLWVPVAAILILVLGFTLFIALETPRARDIAAFQAKIQGGKNLALLAQGNIPELPSDHRYGFAAGAGKVNFFLVGHRYAESLAYAAGGDVEAARQRLAAIAESLGAAPGDLAGVARSGSPSLREIAALEPGLVRIAAGAGAREATLFRGGGWLVNLALAVAARDQAALRAAAPEIRRLQHGLEQAEQAPGALRNLGTLAELSASNNLSDRDYTHAARLIRDIQLALL